MSRFRSRPVRRSAPLLLACVLSLAAVACGEEGPSGGDCGGEDGGGEEGSGCGGDPSARGTAVEHVYDTTEVPEDTFEPRHAASGMHHSS
jgi:hypothetical protein